MTVKIFILAAVILISPFSYANKNGSVTFTNSSKVTAKCQKFSRLDDVWVTFLKLKPNANKSFKQFRFNNKARCNTSLNDGTTVFTYFSIKTKGVYDIIQDPMKLKRKSKENKRDWYWSTLVVLPNGEVKFEQL